MALLVYLAATCGTAEVESDCPIPQPGTRQGDLIAENRGKALFSVLYPCKLPNSQTLTAFDVIGPSGKQTVSITFDGPFQITIRQSQVAPVTNPDPSGASHTVLRNLFPGSDADLIEIYEGSSQTRYDLFWARQNVYYEVLMTGPPLQRKIVLDLTHSLIELP